MRRPLVALACGVLCVASAACAIPTQSSPSTMPRSKVPFDLLDPRLPTTTTTLPNPSSLVPVKVFFLNASNQLTAESRVVSAPAPLDSIVTSMLAGPTSSETAQGVTTAIPSDVRALSVSQPQNNVVTVNMNSDFGLIAGNDTELAVAQIVATVANVAGIGTGVTFEIDGQHTSVPVANGQQVAGPVTLAELLPPTA